MQRPPFRGRHLLAAALLLQLALPATAQLGFRSPNRVPGDPTTDQESEDYCLDWYTADLGDDVGPVDGVIYWPTPLESCEPEGQFPVAVLIHGDGHDYQDYGYLLRHLAYNGFIVASVDAGQGDNVERAERLHNFLWYMFYGWTHKDHLQNNVGLVGHSRGGEAVLTAARKFQVWPAPFEVNAVVSIAPTDNDEGGTEGKEHLIGTYADSYLVIHGSRDEDVYGYSLSGGFPGAGQPLTAPQETGFALYDRAGAEGSTEFYTPPWAIVDKAMVFVDGANHNRFRDVVPCNFVPGILSCQAHQDVAKGYINAFLRWKLRDQAAYENFFTGVWTPAQVASHGARIRQQFSRGAGRRVIDDMEQPTWQLASLGTVSKETTLRILHDEEAYAHPNHTIPHDTRVTVLQWNTSPFTIDPWLRWTIADGTTISGERWRDTNDFDYLSFRAGQMHGSVYNTPGEEQNFSVILRDDAGLWSNEVQVEDWVELAYPESGFIISSIYGPGECPKSSLQTVRIPLHAFAGIDRENVVDIEFRFGDPDRLQGELVIDSLEFTH